MKNYLSEGVYLQIDSAANIKSGDLVQVGRLHGVAVTDGPSGESLNLCMEGVFTLPKLTAAAGDACTAGGLVYFSSGSVSGTDASGTRLPVGYAVAAAAQAATTVQVRLDN